MSEFRTEQKNPEIVSTFFVVSQTAVHKSLVLVLFPACSSVRFNFLAAVEESAGYRLFAHAGCEFSHSEFVSCRSIIFPFRFNTKCPLCCVCCCVRPLFGRGQISNRLEKQRQLTYIDAFKRLVPDLKMIPSCGYQTNRKITIRDCSSSSLCLFVFDRHSYDRFFKSHQKRNTTATNKGRCHFS